MIETTPLHTVIRGLLPDVPTLKQQQNHDELVRRVAQLTHLKPHINKALHGKATRHEKDLALRHLRDALDYLLP